MGENQEDMGEFALPPLKGGAAFQLSLAEDTLSLNAEDGHTVLMLPREEAARYLRFEWDLRRGRLIEFRLLGGLRSMRFMCPAAAVEAVLAWLPARSGRRAQAHNVALMIAGAAGLAWAPLRAVGAMALLAGALGLAPLSRNLSGILAAICGALALASLFGPSIGAIDGSAGGPILYGVVLAMLAIEQLAHAGPNRAVFEARHVAVATGRHASPLVRRVAYAAGAAAAAFLAVGVTLYVLPVGEPGTQAVNDSLVFVVAAISLGAPAPLLLWRARPPYDEALLIAQLLIAVGAVYAWGLMSAALAGAPVDFARGIFAAAIANSTQPYFALPLLLLEFLFRWWFSRAAAREAAEAE